MTSLTGRPDPAPRYTQYYGRARRIGKASQAGFKLALDEQFGRVTPASAAAMVDAWRKTPGGVAMAEAYERTKVGLSADYAAIEARVAATMITPPSPDLDKAISKVVAALPAFMRRDPLATSGVVLTTSSPHRLSDTHDSRRFTAIPDPLATSSAPGECPASGQGCSFASSGPAGEVQCRYCGGEPLTTSDKETGK